MNIFARGQKGKLSDLGCTSQLGASIELQSSMHLDVSCFGVDASDQLSNDRYMIFYNQLASPEGAIRLSHSQGKATFQLNLEALPASIAKLVFCAAIDGDGTMRQIGSGSLKLGEEVVFPLSGADFHEEKAVILGEIYRKDGQWRFSAVGQGFNGGLAALLKHFGGTEAAPPAPPSQSFAPPAEPKKVSLSKITLEKRGDKVSLEKADGRGFGRVRVNLNWNQKPTAAKGGLFGMRSRNSGIDLDLGCLFEMADGTPGAVQALGESWGDYAGWPYVHLDGDDRSGASSDGENLFINGDHFDEIKRILIYTFIYEGVPNWAATDGVITIDVPHQAPVEVRLDHGGAENMCAIAMIENQGGKLQVTKLVDYMGGHEAMDRKYRFGLRWSYGSKD